jgi:hypothetical protein
MHAQKTPPLAGFFVGYLSNKKTRREYFNSKLKLQKAQYQILNLEP